MAPSTLVFDMETALFALELIGSAAFALSGVLVALERELDLLGVLVLGTVTAVGGGALRDILLGRIPPALFQNPVYVAVAAGVSLLAFIVAYCRGERFTAQIARPSGVINLLDAIGLGVFVVVGVRAAISAGFSDNAFLAVFVGAITGVGGGLMRDQLAGRIPMVLQKRVYAIAALAGATLYYAMYRLRFLEPVSVAAGVVLVIAIRLLAAHFKWSLPKVRRQGGE